MILDPDLLHALRTACHVVVFTGAGVSAESGIPAPGPLHGERDFALASAAGIALPALLNEAFAEH